MDIAEKESVLEAARRIAPLIRASANEVEANRQLPRPVFEALADGGIFLMAVPRALGGREVTMPEYVQVIEELAQADASTAWAVNQGTIYGTYAARMRPEVAREIWIDTPRSVVSNSPAPTGQAIPVPGGYRISAEQGFSTGCMHASWIAAHAQVYENGEPKLKDGKPEGMYCLIPKTQVKIVDTWNTSGMRGTGTNHFKIKDVFVPAERTVLSAAQSLDSGGPLYKIPRTLAFACGDATVALGVARSCINAFYELAGAKIPRGTPRLLRDQPLMQLKVGQAEATLRAGRAYLMNSIDELWADAVTDGPIALERRVAIRLSTTHAIRLAAQVVDSLYEAAGVTAVFKSHVMQRYFQDIHVITQHVQASSSHYEVVGRHWMGLSIEDSRI